MLGVLAMLQETQIAGRLFQAFDRDHNTELNFTEFAVALGTMMCGSEDDKLELAFRILNPSFTGTGASLSDYEFESSEGEAESKTLEELPVSPIESANGAPLTPCDSSPDGMPPDATVAGMEWKTQAVQMQQPRQRHLCVHDDHSQGHSPPLQQKRKPRVSAEAFARIQHVVYADSVSTSDFVQLIRAVEASRKILVGDEGPPIPQSEIEAVFLPLTTTLPDGSKRMMQADFRRAVRNSPSFLALLGVDIGGAAADTSAGGQAAKAWDETTDMERVKTEGIFCIDNLREIERQIQTLKQATFVSFVPERQPEDSSLPGKNLTAAAVSSPLIEITEAQEALLTPRGTSATAETEAAAAAAVAAVKCTEQKLQQIIATALSYARGSGDSPVLQQQPQQQPLQISQREEATNHHVVLPYGGTFFHSDTKVNLKPHEAALTQVNVVASLWGALQLNIVKFFLHVDAHFALSASSVVYIGSFFALYPLLGLPDVCFGVLFRPLGIAAKGVAIYFGHHSWNTVINVMLGMRLAGGRVAIAPERSLKPYDFNYKEKFRLLSQTPHEDASPLHPVRANDLGFRLCRVFSKTTVRFTDYAPMVFRRLREMFKIDKTMYIHSIGPEQVVSNLLLGSLASLSELVSEGKSGALFYYTADGKFIIKTVSRESARGLRRLLPDYLEHFVKNPESLLSRFLGLHAVKHTFPRQGRLSSAANRMRHKTYFLVMENLFHTPVPIHRRYDLKGSTYKRSLALDNRADPTAALKDNDLEREGEKIDIGPERAARLVDLLRRDSKFLMSHSLMDYSLLVGIYYSHKESPPSHFHGCGGDTSLSTNRGAILASRPLRSRKP
ncbi:phosphatidylinositol-4-phosphate 5- phosphatidylinositol-4-phosphate 5-kinase [Cyclospora cayetanensis]|uniref:Phosphatidylinositol-4-phosphate 5-phosphatidylinositol-4-phosphate 5-kinase n=1 Tax=Cyclospora cayetanensis TaxID=88456 RepID=A0A1D3D3S0_9EIME|nr:phosphatidylinositol-4-phosphate 5- phosphatidylinositol-4-phosphate 5-kinase [Cyclospora cayetanensis]